MLALWRHSLPQGRHRTRARSQRLWQADPRWMTLSLAMSQNASYSEIKIRMLRPFPNPNRTELDCAHILDPVLAYLHTSRHQYQPVRPSIKSRRTSEGWDCTRYAKKHDVQILETVGVERKGQAPKKASVQRLPLSWYVDPLIVYSSYSNCRVADGRHMHPRLSFLFSKDIQDATTAGPT